MMRQYQYKKQEEQGRERIRKPASMPRTQYENIPGYLPQREQGSVTQLLRLRINDDPEDNEQFGRLRKVIVSPSATADKSNCPAGLRLQQANTPNVEGRHLWNRPGDWWNELSEYGPEGQGHAQTLERHEDIILEGHGTDTGMENYTPEDLAAKAAAIIRKCGYTAANPWQGRLILLGCDTGRFAAVAAAALERQVGFHAIVIGTQHNIRVNQINTGTMYAEDEWQDEDPKAPTNLNDIKAFYDFTSELFTQIEEIGRLGKELKSAVEAQFRATIQRDHVDSLLINLIDKFETCSRALQGMNIPPQPQNISFLQGEVPAQTDHYRGSANGNDIPVGTTADAEQIKTNLIDTLEYLIRETPPDWNPDNFGFLWYTLIVDTAIDSIVTEWSNILDLYAAFRIARHRRIDFQNLNHITRG